VLKSNRNYYHIVFFVSCDIISITIGRLFHSAEALLELASERLSSQCELAKSNLLLPSKGDQASETSPILQFKLRNVRTSKTTKNGIVSECSKNLGAGEER
jgi:hypothetical protein